MATAYYTVREPTTSAISHALRVRVTREKQKAIVYRVVARNCSGTTGYIEVWVVSTWGDMLVARQASLTARVPIVVDMPFPVPENAYIVATFVTITEGDVLETYVMADIQDA